MGSYGTDLGSYGGGTDLGSYGGSGYDLGSYGTDLGSYGGSGYDLGSYGSGTDLGSYGSGSGYDLGSYGGGSGYDLGSYGSGSGYDLGSYGGNNGYDLGSYGGSGYDLGSYGGSNCVTCYSPSSSYDSYYTYTPTNTTPCCTPTYTPPSTPCCTPQYPPTQPPIVYNFGSPSHPVTFSTPAPQQQQQQQQQQQGGGPINIVNNNNNVNTNTNSNPVTVTTVTPIAAAPVSYPIQYVFPQTPTYTQAPFCTITLSYGGYQGGAATLTWYSSYATSGYITPGIGAVAPSGSRTVYSGSGTVYTMGVAGQGGSNTCQTTVYNNYVAQPSVALSQIPYTGFDFGPVGNAIYWLSLLSFAVAGAYLLVYYRGGAFTLATALVANRSSKIVKAIEEAPAVAKGLAGKPAKAIESVIAPIAHKIDRVMELVNLPVATAYKPTTDVMTVKHSKEGEVPRIVIARR